MQELVILKNKKVTPPASIESQNKTYLRRILAYE